MSEGILNSQNPEVKVGDMHFLKMVTADDAVIIGMGHDLTAVASLKTNLKKGTAALPGRGVCVARTHFHGRIGCVAGRSSVLDTFTFKTVPVLQQQNRKGAEAASGFPGFRLRGSSFRVMRRVDVRL